MRFSWRLTAPNWSFSILYMQTVISEFSTDSVVCLERVQSPLLQPSAEGSSGGGAGGGGATGRDFTHTSATGYAGIQSVDDFVPLPKIRSASIVSRSSQRRKSVVDEIDVPSNITMSTKDVIGRSIGDWGRWQLRTVFLIFLVKIPSAWFMACIIFTAPAPRHGEFYCKPPIPIPSHVNHTEYVKISHPVIEANEQELKIDFCNVYEDALDHLHLYFNASENIDPRIRPNSSSKIVPCETFEHHSDYKSIITDFDLVCSKEILVATTQFFHLFGVLCGGLVATKFLVHLSPRRVMLIGMLSQIVCGNLTGFVTTYGMHVFFRCMSAVCCGLMYTAGAVIFSDITAGKYKTIVCTMFEQFWSVGVILLPGVASFLSSWSYIYMAISMPTFLLIFLHRWIPDSPRWLLARGRIEEVKNIIVEAARMNGTMHLLPRDLEFQLEDQANESLDSAPPPPNWWSLFQGPKAKRNVISVHLVWSIYIITYYGMLLNIRGFGRDYLQVNTVVAGTCEIIGTFIGLYLILNTSRKWLLTGIFNVLAGLFAFSIWAIPSSLTGIPRVVLLMTTAMGTKIAISSTLAILTTCTTELVTSEKKRMCAFSTIVWARIWLLCAPFIGATSIFGQFIPQTFLGVMSIVGGFITMLISSPRTLPKTSKIGSKLNYPKDLRPEIWTIKEQSEKNRD